MSARNSSQGEKAATESFNIVNIGEAKDGFVLAVVGGEVAFSSSFMGGGFVVCISKEIGASLKTGVYQ